MAMESEQLEVLKNMFPSHVPSSSLKRGNRSSSIDLSAAANILSVTDLTDMNIDVHSICENLGKRCLSCVACHLFTVCQLIDSLDVDTEKMRCFFRAVEDGYHDIPYHNQVHATDVLMRVHAISHKARLSPEVRAALYIAASAHDYGHMGVTNTYLIATRHVLARRYHNHSPLENYHTSATIQLLNQEQTAFISSDHLGSVCVLIRDLILATDIERHVEMMRPPTRSEEEQKWFLQLCLKAADIGHTATPERIHLRWLAAFRRELSAQQFLEDRAGLPLTLPALEATHAKFFDYIVLPMLAILSAHVPHTAALRANAVKNRQLYTDKNAMTTNTFA